MSEKKVLGFEEAFEALEFSAEALRKPNISLDEALASYERGVKYYETCNEILSQTKQKIQTYGKDVDIDES